MELLLLALAVVLAVGVLALVAYAVRRVEHAQAQMAEAARRREVEDAQTRTQIDGLQQAVLAQLATVQQSVTAQVGQTQGTLGELRERLGSLQEQSREVAALAKDVGSLQDLLRPPKMRGGIGEVLLEQLLEELVPGRWERQYEFPSTRTRVDAVVRIGDKLVPIDAKFPLDMFVEMTKLSGEERAAKRRAFLSAVRKHVDDIAARYIVPQDGGIDFCFMYIPAENLWFEMIVREDGEAGDLRQYCQQRRVLPVSPNTLQAFLAAVLLGLKGMAIQENARRIQAHLAQVAQDLARFEAEHQKVGRHLENARTAQIGSERLLGRVGERLQQANAVSAIEPHEEARQLPLAPGDDDGEDRA